MEKSSNYGQLRELFNDGSSLQALWGVRHPSP